MSEERQHIFHKLLQTRVLNAIVAGCIVALGVLYIGQVNASANKALQIAALEKKNQALHVDAERLATKIDELRSLDSVMQRQQLLGLVHVGQVAYIHGGPNTVAIR